MLKLTINTPERRHWRRSGVVVVNFKHFTHFLVFLSLTFKVYFLAEYFFQMQKLFDTWSIRWSNYSYILRSTGIFWNNLYFDCKELSKCRNANFHTKMYLNTSRNCCKSCRHTLKKKERIEKCNKDFFFWEILVCNCTFVFRTRQSRRSGVFIVNCKDISYLSLMFLLLILNRKMKFHTWNFKEKFKSYGETFKLFSQY